MPPPPAAPPTGAVPASFSEHEVRMHRAFGAISACGVLAYGAVYQHLLPGIVDPWPYRVAAAGACLAVVVASYRARGRAFDLTLYVSLAFVTVWVLGLLHLNAFAGDYAVGFLMVVSVICALLPGPRALAIYGAATLAALAAVGATVPAPRLNPLLYASYLAGVLGVFFVAALARARAARVLAASEARYALTARGAHDGLWDWDVPAGTVYYSPRWKAIVGCVGDEVAATPEAWLARVHPDDAAGLRAELLRQDAPGDGLFELEYRIAHQNGAYRWVHVRGVRVADAAGAVVRVAGSQTDISDRKQIEQQLTHQAYHDTLTGLANRARFRDRLARAAAEGGAAALAVLYVDLDDFKGVNDTLGHAAGDALLVAVAERLLRATRGCDTVARLGGDEFAVLLRGVRDAGEAVIVAERVAGALATPVPVHGAAVRVRASIGIALGSDADGAGCAGGGPSPGLGGDTLLRFADAAMYAAKHDGKGSHALFDPAMHRRAQERRALEQDLHGAAERGELVAHYQPIVVLGTGQVVSAEALVRWQHPARGLVSPADFIPAAERTGCVVGIGRWMLATACRDAAAWRAAGGPVAAAGVSVNVSAAQLQRPELVDEVRAALADAGLPAAALTLEITETAMLADPEAAAARLRDLKALGVAIAVDDFGTGYSSLSYLQRFPVDVLKIDKSFVDGVAVPGHDPELTRAIVALGGALGLRVVAEGIERSDQAAALGALGCTLGQGYLFARPLPAPEFVALVAAGA